MKHITTIEKDDHVVLKLNRGKANPMNHQMIRDLRTALKNVSENPDLRGLIITGNTPGYFSVGLDIIEIFNYDQSEIEAFWQDWEAMIMELLEFPKPILAAINGHCPAGGCVLAITCDYRMMASDDKYKIGLNEIAVGITVPTYIYQLFSFWSGSRVAYQSLMAAKLFSPSQAFKIGLVDELHSLESLEGKAEERMSQMLLAPGDLIRRSKQNMRADLMKQIRNNKAVSSEERLEAWFDPEARKVMQSVVDNLIQRSRKS